MDHSLLQAIARVNRTSKNKFRGYIVDYYGLSDYLTEALDMFTSDDVEGALIDLKEEIPRLTMNHGPNRRFLAMEDAMSSLNPPDK